MKIIAIIPARGGSKRLPRKNIREVNGKPMIYWAIKACQESNYGIEAWVTSEDEEILSIAVDSFAKVIKRPAYLADDETPKQYTISHALELFEEDPPDIVISLQANSPGIKSEMLDLGIAKLLKYDRQEIFSVDLNGIQNGAFRIMRYPYALQKDLSTNCGIIVCDLIDVHEEKDLEAL